MQFWSTKARHRAMNEKKASKKTQNAMINSFHVLRELNCDHIYKDGECMKCHGKEVEVEEGNG